MKALFFETWSSSPHLETCLELARKCLDAGTHVKYYFMGRDTPYKDGGRLGSLYGRILRPERRGARLIRSPLLEFIPRVKIPRVNWQSPGVMHTIDELREFRFGQYDAGLAVASSVISATNDSNPDVAAMSDEIHDMLDSSIRVYCFVKQKLLDEKPDVVYVFNGRFVHHRAILQAAQHSGVKVLIHERGGNNSRYFLQPFVPHDNIRWQAEMLSEWSHVGQRGDALEAGKSYFVRQREDRYGNRGSGMRRGGVPPLPPHEKLVTYFASSDHEFQACGDVVKWDRWPNQISALKDLIEVCGTIPGLLLVIRFHPNFANLSKREKQVWSALLRLDKVLTIDEASPVDTYALIEMSDVVVTAGSTVGIESVYWGTPSILLGPAGYSELGAVYKPADMSELKMLLESDVLSADSSKALPYGYYFTSFGEPFEFYKPLTSFSGTFLGRNLQERPLWLKPFYSLYKLAKRARRLMTPVVRISEMTGNIDARTGGD